VNIHGQGCCISGTDRRTETGLGETLRPSYEAVEPRFDKQYWIYLRNDKDKDFPRSLSSVSQALQRYQLVLLVAVAVHLFLPGTKAQVLKHRRPSRSQVKACHWTGIHVLVPGCSVSRAPPKQ
jgi:hypothetical protein